MVAGSYELKQGQPCILLDQTPTIGTGMLVNNVLEAGGVLGPRFCISFAANLSDACLQIVEYFHCKGDLKQSTHSTEEER